MSVLSPGKIYKYKYLLWEEPIIEQTRLTYSLLGKSL